MPKLDEVLKKYKDTLGDDAFNEITGAIDSYKTNFTEKHVAKLEKLSAERDQYKESADKYNNIQIKSAWIEKGYSEDKFEEARDIYGDNLTVEKLEEVAKSAYWKSAPAGKDTADITLQQQENNDDQQDDDILDQI